MHELRGKKIGVIRGGGGSQHHQSLASGKDILEALANIGATPVDIVLDQNDDILIRGRKVSAIDIMAEIDALWNATHGYNPIWNELFNTLGVSNFASALTSRPALWKEKVRGLDLSVPKHVDFKGEDAGVATRSVVGAIVPPWIVKTNGKIKKEYMAGNYVELIDILRTLKQAGENAIVEEYVDGREFVVSMIENFRGKSRYDLPVLEIVVGANGEEQYLSPKDFSSTEKNALADLGALLSEELGLQDFASFRVIMTPKKMYIVDIESRPPHHSASPFSRGLEQVGASLEEFIASRFDRYNRE